MKRRILLLTALVLLCFLLSGCTTETVPPTEEAQPAAAAIQKAISPDISELTLMDNDSLYSEYDPLAVPCFYVTVRKGNEADGTDHTLAEVDSYLNLQGMTNVEKIYASAIVQVGDENGPVAGEVGYGETEPNATINVRGRTSTGYEQKSYRLNLNDNAGLWRGQRAIALNKHPGDPTRIRNTLYFRLLQDVPGMVSLRTQFVHLYVKDETAEIPGDSFVDYGLFTQVELPNNRYMRNHGLSRDSYLYKANFCELYRYEDKLKLATDRDFNAAAFNEVLEPKISENHEKLLAMLDDLNDYSQPIEQVIQEHFDLENLTSYIAFNLLMGNADSEAQNYFLYSPVNSQKWYFICWDGDGCLSYNEDLLLNNQFTEGEWTKGISNYWGVVLYNRMLRVSEYRQAVIDKMELLHRTITPNKVRKLVEQYRTVVAPFLTRMPDAINLRMEHNVLEQIYDTLPDELEVHYNDFLASLEQPTPFYLNPVESSGQALQLSWGDSFDFDAEFIYYDVQVSTDWRFLKQNMVYESKHQLGTTASCTLPDAGTYFWRVIATNESGFSQQAFDAVTTSTGIHNGMLSFTVGVDGSVSNLQ